MNITKMHPAKPAILRRRVLSKDGVVWSVRLDLPPPVPPSPPIYHFRDAEPELQTP